MKKLNGNLQKQIEYFKQQFNENSDFLVREFKVDDIQACCMFSNWIVDLELIGKSVLEPLIGAKNLPKSKVISYIDQNVLFFPDSQISSEADMLIEGLTKGKAVVMLEGQKDALLLGVDSYEERSIIEPPTSAVLKGPRRGFVESYKTNLSLLKQILATEHLKTINIKVGEISNTDVVIVYLDNVCDKKLPLEIEKKIREIKIDGIIDSYYIGQFLEEKPYSIFKQIGNSEKPDVVCAKLLEGRVAILVNGSPIVLTLPFILLEDIQSPDDYYSNSKRATIVRLIRIVSIFITLMLPGMYIAVQLYHYKIIPLTFIITIVNTTLGLPLSPFAETLFVLILFEILYEASIRMPKYLGIALSIVGALILGDTAVSAGVISPPAVMIVALSGITLYTIPDQAPQFIVLRLLFTIMGGLLGFYGIIGLMVYLVFYLNDMDSFGSPYLAPFSPLIKQDFQDATIKLDIVDLKNRPKSIKNINKRRMTHGNKTTK